MAHGNGAESISVVSAVGANKSSKKPLFKNKGGNGRKDNFNWL